MSTTPFESYDAAIVSVAQGAAARMDDLAATVPLTDEEIASAVGSAPTSGGTVGGGIGNTLAGLASTVSGGQDGKATADHATVSGGNAGEATGIGATVGGGRVNKASGGDATVGGGFTGVASADYATVGGGDRNQATAARSAVAGGSQNIASGDGASVSGGASNVANSSGASVTGGGSNTASGTYAQASGFSCVASGAYSVASGRSAASPLYGARAHASGQFSTAGDAQIMDLTLRRTTATATMAELMLDGSGTRIVPVGAVTWGVKGQVVARRIDTVGEVAVYDVSFVVHKGTPGATPVVSGLTVTPVVESVTAWDVTVAADSGTGSVQIRVTGEAGKTIRWVAGLRVTQVAS